MSTSSNVVEIGTARPAAGRSDKLRITIDKGGDLVLRLPGCARFAIEGEYAERLMERLHLALRRARYKRLGLPTERPDTTPKETPPTCRRARDGGVRVSGEGGCRRRRAHPGECKDKDGSYMPATCSHIGRSRTRISNAAPPYDDHLVCSYCYARVTR